MAAYAAVVSLVHLMEQIQVYHARNPIFLDKQQRQLESLHEKVSFLQYFLENYSCGDSNEREGLESRIIDVVYTAEDVIGSYIVNDIHGRSWEKQSKKNKIMVCLEKIKKNLGKFTTRTEMAVNRFSQDIQKVIECMDSIKREVLEFKDESGILKYPQPKEPEQVGSFKLLNFENDTVVGFDDILNSIMEKLTAQKSDLQVVAITGMGGSGKSTLAKKVYDDRFTKEHFDFCAWVTISQEFNAEEVLLALLRETGGLTDQTKQEDFEYHELGEQIHKHLLGRRFFIVIDDIWSVEAWDRIKMFLQDSNSGSRIVITTRLSNLANNIGSFHTFKMNLLDENESWSLLRKKVFGQESCPPELEEVGKVVAKNCKGLPLSIVVIGGLLWKSIKLEYWEYIAKDISASVNSEENERCLKILYMSYNHLPIHLKPCFLYFGVFPEDHEIRVGELIKLWVAERFLKPNEDKSLEEVAGDYLKDLIDSNLIFVTKLGCTGNVKRCKVHDLLRDLCIREATKNRFLYVSNVLKLKTSQGFNCRRLAVCRNILYLDYSHPQFRPLEYSSSSLRSLICNFKLYTLPYSHVKLLNVLKLDKCYLPEVILKLVNSRYLDFTPRDYDRSNPPIPGSVNFLWNLQTLIIGCDGVFSLPSEIWEMSQLRHVIISEFTLDDPCDGKLDTEDNIVLENLQTLSCIHDFRCSEEVLQKIPNLQKLGVLYLDHNFPSCYLKNIGRLTKLESLKCKVAYGNYLSLSALDFSLSLKNLYISAHYWEWKDIGEKIGLLPHLEKFSLLYFYGGKEWNLVDGQFPRLKYLFMAARGLVHWTVENTPFPCLEHLCLSEMQRLEEIPSEIGDIPTLQSIKACRCSDSVAYSAKMILEEQRSLGNEDLLVAMVKKIYD